MEPNRGLGSPINGKYSVGNIRGSVTIKEKMLKRIQDQIVLSDGIEKALISLEHVIMMCDIYMQQIFVGATFDSRRG